jgi:hypothetical protein
MGSEAYVTIKVAFVALLLVNAVLWSQGSHSQVHRGHALLSTGPDFSKRSLLGLLASEQYSNYDGGESKVRGYIDRSIHLHSQSASVPAYSCPHRTSMRGRVRHVSRIGHGPIHPVPPNLFLRQSHCPAVRVCWSTALAHVPVYHPRH